MENKSIGNHTHICAAGDVAVVTTEDLDTIIFLRDYVDESDNLSQAGVRQVVNTSMWVFEIICRNGGVIDELGAELAAWADAMQDPDIRKDVYDNA